jgi:queuine tRNA-ribosyltransferase
MQFHIIETDSSTAARTGELVTSRGTIHTPVFMPVATRGAVRALSGRDVDELDFDIILSNTYHLYLRPGMEVMEKAGGLHKFMNFHRSILTDSGGFQVFSLSDFCKVRDHGVEFRSHVDGSLHTFTPESVLEIQKTIGSDIMMVLDQCTHYPIEERPAREAMERTVGWARSSFNHWTGSFDTGKQALFAIVQGSVFPELRRECVSLLAEYDFPGFAIGGLSVGEPGDLYREITELTLSLLPAGRPRYMMGVGSPMEILYAIRQGTDMFDSVMPTRIARNGTLFTSAGRVNIKSAVYETDQAPLDEACGCYVCRTYTRSYLRHLFRAGEISALIYNTHHNLFFMNSFMNEARKSIAAGDFESTYNKWKTIYENRDN